ncbi:hypothetical protein NXS19_007209 [Fusarium pseudograminearum]|nr:hypothetical protein NXS19_007209 [Fusarium pseudograminearum]
MQSSTETNSTLAALTLAYEQPNGCKNVFKTTSIGGTGSSTATSVMVSDFVTSCHPSGSGDSDSAKALSFSPGVCPSGWNYNAIARVTHSSTVATTAFCCASGYQFRSLHQDQYSANSVVSDQCESWSKGAEVDSGSAIVTSSHGDGTLIVHQAWAITWDASNRATPSPKPPALSSEQTIRSWEALTSVKGEALFTKRRNEGPGTTTEINFLMIGLPIIFGALFICLFCMCFWNRRKMRKRGQEVPLESLPPRSSHGSPPAYGN